MDGSSRKKVILHEMATEKILTLIKDRRLKQGDKLPTERELAKLLEISRTSVRETLQTLEANSIVVIKHGSGIYVDVFDDSMLAPYCDTSDSNQREVLLVIKNLVQARVMVEPFCIQLVAPIITPEQINTLYQHEQEEYERMYSRNGVTAAPGLDFEQLIISFQPNPILTNIHKRLNSSWKSYLALINAVVLSPDKRHKDHLAIIRAIETKNPIKIEKALYRHVHKTEMDINSLLKKGDLKTDE